MGTVKNKNITQSSNNSHCKEFSLNCFFSPLIHFLLLLTLLLERRLSFRKSWRLTWSTPKPVCGLSGGGDSQGWKGGSPLSPVQISLFCSFQGVCNQSTQTF